ncbi:ribonuclease H2, subunit C [Lactifluus subvellereus]|nr:ribonuclease H2, subunit C [Lactifluus subvellereus]
MITIAQGHPNLPVRVPHLMPFHIHHTGPAPVSTYFRVQPAPLPPSVPTTHPAALTESGTQLPTVSVAATTEVTLEDKDNAPIIATPTAEVDTVAKASTPRLLRRGPIERLSESAKRFISSFRGRTVHGVEVALPKGYMGAVLRGDADGRGPQTATSKTKRRSAWQLRGKPTEERLDDTSEALSEEDGPVRTLKPAARFDSFVLWHPDIPVDEGKDEYLRSLSEWVNIAAEVRVGDCLPPQPSGDDVQIDSSK